MNQRDFKNYRGLFESYGINDRRVPIYSLIYLRSSIPNLVNKIHKRGRDYENSASVLIT